MSLEILGAIHNTDKLTHGFLPFYESFMKEKKNEPIQLLEVGVFYGASIKMWAEYFSNDNAKIVGADWFEGKQGNASYFPNPRYIFSQQLSPKIRLVELDQSRKEHIQRFMNSEVEYTYDYILDDGSHLMKDQQLTFILLFPLLKHGGTFIIEDLHTSFDNGYDIEKGKMTTYDMVESILRNTYPELAYIPLPKDVFENIASVQLFRSKSGSMTCAIVRK